jgi:ectoine hydroxylase-related dioxygenase (phytanoyl-CoA dioxygenase family)
MLYQDQQEAMERRALFEQELLASPQELQSPKLKIPKQKSGTGFGATSTTLGPLERLAAEQAKVVRKEGVLRIDQALSPELTDKLREYVLEQQVLAQVQTDLDVDSSKAFYGVENARQHRCDLQLSLLRGGYAADKGGDVARDLEASHVLADSLQALVGADGSLRFLYENLVTSEGELYELAAVITDPGSKRQQVHPDLPFQEEAPLYVIFLALQDVTEEMGPTSFLMRTHTLEANKSFFNVAKKDEQLSGADCRLSTLKKGDAVLFDARILHCGNANHPVDGSTRALFNFSFRNPKVTGDLGYPGSIRPGYNGAMNLGDLSDALALYENGNKEPFAIYGDGLNRPRP